MRRNQVTDTGLGYLTDITTLRELNLQATQVTDRGLLQYIPKLSQLQGLTIAYLDVTDECLEPLLQLQRLNLQHTAISNNAIVVLMNKTSHTLRHLNISNTVVNDRALAKFPDESQLLDLKLIDTGISDAGCGHIARCHRLTDLRLDLTDVTDDGIRYLASCKHLKNLELFKTRVTDTSLVWLSDSSIEYLGLGYTSFTDVGIPALAELSKLHSLDLQATAISDKGLRFLTEASLLKQLFLDNCKISNSGIEFLLKIPLESLSLNSGLDDRGLGILSHHDTLRRLAVWDTKVTSWQPLSLLDELQVLLIDDSVEDLMPLQALRQLKFLLLWGNSFSATQVARLRLSLPKCQIKHFEPHKRAVHEFRTLCWCV